MIREEANAGDFLKSSLNEGYFTRQFKCASTS